MPNSKKNESLIPTERIEQKIYVIRGEWVMLDGDLADIYGVTTKRFNEQVKRNSERFPEDFMFQLTADEHEALRSQSVTANKDDMRSQNVTSKSGRGGAARFIL